MVKKEYPMPAVGKDSPIPKKNEWFTPTLKEVEIEALTQAGGMNTSDTPSNNKSGS